MDGVSGMSREVLSREVGGMMRGGGGDNHNLRYIKNT